MKKINLILAAFCLLIQSCANDEGNYDYIDINEVEFGNINEEYNVMTNSTILEIDPTLTMTEGVDPDSDRFAYEWVCVASNGTKYTLATTRSINKVVSLPLGNYTLYLKVKDNVTDLQWTTSTYLTVGTIYTKGILLIGEDEEGNAEAQMLSMVEDTKLISNILKNSGLPILKGPISFIHTGTPYSSSYDVAVKVWVMTESGSYWLDRESMQGTTENHVSKILYTSIVPTENLRIVDVAPQIINSRGSVGSNFYRAMVTSDGLLFSTSMGTNKDNYLDPVNRLSATSNEILTAFPFIFYPLKNYYGPIWYDTKNDRFMRATSSGTYSFTLVDKTDDKFPWNQGTTGRKLVYGENTYNKDGGKNYGNSFALMKDQQGKYFIYKMYAYGSKPEKIDAYSINLDIATNFSNATMYAFSSLRTVLFYVANNKLYAYDYDPGNEKLYQFDLFGSSEITMLKFDTQINPDANALYIATYDAASKGKLTRYVVNTDPNTVTLTADTENSWEGLIKVKNFSWRPQK